MPSPRMTRDLIAQIVASALNATNLNAEREQIITDTKARVFELLLAKVPPEFIALTNIYPREWFQWQNQVYTGHQDHNPIHIVGRPYLSDGKDHRGAYLVVEPSIPSLPSSGASLKADVELADLIKRANDWITKRDAAQMQLRQFLASCSTVAKAIERMPEIEKHIPPAATKTAYPIVASTSALSALTAIGFDTTAKA